jgi:pseudoazurin
MKSIILSATLLLSSPCLAGDVSIEMLNRDADGNKMVFSQEIVNIISGDTINWIPSSMGHNVEIITSPNETEFKSKTNREAKFTFTDPGIYYYLCTPHKSMGMIGLVIVDEDTSNIAEIAKSRAVGKSKKKLKVLLSELS